LKTHSILPNSSKMANKLPFEVSLPHPGITSKGDCADKVQVKNPSLFKDMSLVNGEWVEARSGKRFDVVGMASITPVSGQILIPLQIPETEKSGPLLQTTQPKTSMLQS
jgi:hypothetical protein